jgi:hypothetical protein
VKTVVDERFREESARFRLRFACDDCAHFDAGGSRCSMEFPAEPRRDALDQPFVELCKSFELGR